MSPERLRLRIGALAALLVAANLGVWAWAAAALHDSPALMATALLAYSFGLRHAVDADHIAAIDNVTRKLMQDGRRPITVGFWFAAGHSAVVLLAAALLAGTAGALAGIKGFQRYGGVVSTVVSAGFLFAIAAMNLIILKDVARAFGRVRRGETAAAEADVLTGSGPAARLFRPLFRLVTRSWHMAPLGFLFGLGFDTATEVALLGLSASQGLHGAPLAVVLVFPALFAAGMSLVDTADGVLMLGVYRWAFVSPVRKLYYNMTITLVSALIALGIGGVESAALIADKLGLRGGGWDAVAFLGAHFNLLGFVIVGVLAASWLASALVWRLRRFDRLPA